MGGGFRVFLCPLISLRDKRPFAWLGLLGSPPFTGPHPAPGLSKPAVKPTPSEPPGPSSRQPEAAQKGLDHPPPPCWTPGPWGRFLPETHGQPTRSRRPVASGTSMELGRPGPEVRLCRGLTSSESVSRLRKLPEPQFPHLQTNGPGTFSPWTSCCFPWGCSVGRTPARVCTCSASERGPLSPRQLWVLPTPAPSSHVRIHVPTSCQGAGPSSLSPPPASPLLQPLPFSSP